MTRCRRLGILNSHPIQYFTPLYQRLGETADIEPLVYFCSRQGLQSYRDAGFGDVEVRWDIPLLDGYASRFLNNWSPAPRVGGRLSLVNPSIVTALRGDRLDALLVHGHAYATDLMATATARALGVPLLMRSDANISKRRSALVSRIRPAVLNAYYRLFDGFLTIGTCNEAYYRYHGVPEHKMFRTPMAVDGDRIEAASLPRSAHGAFKRDHGLEADLPLIFYAAKMQHGKRVTDLLLAFDALTRQGGVAQLAFAGDGVEREALEALIAERRPPRVHVLGFLNQSELPAWMSAADVLVLPAEQEAWGLVVNEAMHAATPVISTRDVGASLDLIEDGVTGFVYDAGDVSQLAHHLSSIVSAPEEAYAMGLEARDRMRQHWSYSASIRGIRRALDACC